MFSPTLSWLTGERLIRHDRKEDVPECSTALEFRSPCRQVKGGRVPAPAYEVTEEEPATSVNIRKVLTTSSRDFPGGTWLKLIITRKAASYDV